MAACEERGAKNEMYRKALVKGVRVKGLFLQDGKVCWFVGCTCGFNEEQSKHDVATTPTIQQHSHSITVDALCMSSLTRSVVRWPNRCNWRDEILGKLARAWLYVLCIHTYIHKHIHTHVAEMHSLCIRCLNIISRMFESRIGTLNLSVYNSYIEWEKTSTTTHFLLLLPSGEWERHSDWLSL